MKSNPKKLTEDNNHTLEEEQTKHKTLKIKQLETARLQTIGNSTIEYNSSNLKRRQNNALTLTNINIRNNSYNFKCRKERCNNWNLPTVSEPLTLINPTTQPPPLIIEANTRGFENTHTYIYKCLKLKKKKKQ